MEEQSILRRIWSEGQFFTIANLLSLLRIPLGFYLYYATIQQETALIILTIGLIVLTDYGDGYFARKMNQVSELGKVLDPLADKIGVALGLYALYLSYGLSLWILVVIVARDVIIVLASIMLASKLPYVTPSAMAGKIFVNILAAIYLAYILTPHYPQIEPALIPLEILGLIFLVISSLDYGLKFIRNMKNDGTPPAGEVS